jgi:hypothetical protein
MISESYLMQQRLQMQNVIFVMYAFGLLIIDLWTVHDSMR